MFMHDHEKPKPQPMYCTLMKEICHGGWTESMGVNKETGEKPSCHKWVGVFINDPRATPPIKEVFDCNEKWGTDLTQQIAQEVYQGAAATEQVRNKVAEQGTHVQVANLFFQAIAARMRAKVVLPTMPPGKVEALEHQNGDAP